MTFSGQRNTDKFSGPSLSCASRVKGSPPAKSHDKKGHTKSFSTTNNPAAEKESTLDLSISRQRHKLTGLPYYSIKHKISPIYSKTA